MKLLTNSFAGTKEEVLDYIQEEVDNESYNCKFCKDTGRLEIMGDGGNFEWDVVGYRDCQCQE